MSKKKNIVVIDDVGDLVQLLGTAFQKYEAIGLTQVSSEVDQLNEILDVEDYMIIINEGNLNTDIRQLVEFLYSRTKYTIAPIIVATDKPFNLSDDVKKLIPVISVISKNANPQRLGHHLSNIIDSIESNRNQNALSGLPGSNVITSQLIEKVQSGKDFAMMYIDLDNFKEYNEYYGFYKGDKVILFLMKTLYDVMGECGIENDFVGHVGGDDFIMIVQNPDIVKEVGKRIISHFDKGIKSYYKEQDLKKGYIDARNRKGEIERINIMSISIIVVYADEFRTTQQGEMYKKIMLYKKQAKMVKGSVCYEANTPESSSL